MEFFYVLNMDLSIMAFNDNGNLQNLRMGIKYLMSP